VHLAPDDGRKHRPKHVELAWNNKLIYIVHLAPDDGRKHRPKQVELTRNNKLTYICISLVVFIIIASWSSQILRP